MLITIIIIFILLLHQQTRHIKIRTETKNNHVRALFSLAFCRVSSSLSTTVNLLILSSSKGVVFSDDYKSTKKSLNNKIRNYNYGSELMFGQQKKRGEQGV